MSDAGVDRHRLAAHREADRLDRFERDAKRDSIRAPVRLMFTTRAVGVTSNVPHRTPTTSSRTRARRSPSGLIGASGSSGYARARLASSRAALTKDSSDGEDAERVAMPIDDGSGAPPLSVAPRLPESARRRPQRRRQSPLITAPRSHFPSVSRPGPSRATVHGCLRPTCASALGGPQPQPRRLRPRTRSLRAEQSAAPCARAHPRTGDPSSDALYYTPVAAERLTARVLQPWLPYRPPAGRGA